jgi:hypothetical protein
VNGRDNRGVDAGRGRGKELKIAAGILADQRANAIERKDRLVLKLSRRDEDRDAGDGRLCDARHCETILARPMDSAAGRVE